MAERIPDAFLDLFQKPVLAHLATLMPDGTPQVTPVWIDYDGQYLLVNTAPGRQKDSNMIARPAVALDIVDPAAPFRFLAVRGRVVAHMTDGAIAHSQALTRRYLGLDHFPDRSLDSPRRVFKIAIESLVAHEGR